MSAGFSIAIKFGPELDAGKLNGMVRGLRGQLRSLLNGVRVIDPKGFVEGFRQAEGLAAKFKGAMKGLLGGNKIVVDGQEANGVLRGLTQTARRARDALSDVDGEGNRIGGTFGKLSGLVKGAGLAALAAGALHLGGAMVKGNAEMEVYERQLTTLLGSAAQAKTRLAELARFGAETPFELPELIKAEKVLIGFGLQGERALKLTGKSGAELRTVIGDIAAGVGVGFDELAVTFGKFSAGATGEALSRLQELGIVTKEQLAQVGIEFDKAGSLVSPIDKAMTAAIQIAEKKFGGGMKGLSETFEGQLSTLKDSAAAILRDLGAPLFASMKGALGQINGILASPEFTAAIGKVGEAIVPIAEIITNTLATLAPAITSLLVPIAATVKILLGPIADTVGGLATSLGGALQALAGPLGLLLTTLATQIVAIVTPILSALLPAIDAILGALSPVLGAVANLLAIIVPLVVAFNPLTAILSIAAQLLSGIVQAIAPLIEGFARMAQQLLGELQPAFAAISEVVQIFAGLLAEGLGFAIKTVIDIGFALLSAIGQLIAAFIGAKNGGDAFQKILGFVRKAVEFVRDGVLSLKAALMGIKSAFEVVKQVIGQFVDAVSNFDIAGAIKAFAGFGEKVSAAYRKGMESVAQTSEATVQAVEQGTAEVATKTEETVRKSADVGKKAAKTVETAWQAASKAFTDYKKQSQSDNDVIQRSRELLRIQERREKSALDEVLAERDKLNLAQKQFDRLRELLKLAPDANGGFTIGIALKNKDEAAAAEQLIRETIATLEEQRNKFTEIRFKLLPELSEKEIADLQRERLNLEITLGIRNPRDLDVALEDDLVRLKRQYEEFTDARTKLLETARTEGILSEEEYQAQLKTVQAGGLREQYELQKQILQKQVELRDRQADRETKILEAKHKREQELAERSARIQQRIVETVFKVAEKVAHKAIDQQSALENRKLEARQRQGLISEERAAVEKERIEVESAARREALDARLRGERLEAERQAALEKLKLDREQLREKEQQARSSGRIDEANGLLDEIDELTSEIEKKSSVLSGIGEELQGNLTEVFSNLFQGDAEAIKNPFRQGLQILVGALKRIASAKVTEVLLGSISGLAGIPGLLAAIGAKPIIEGVMNSILAPVFNSLLSFSSGGRIDQPTLAIVGDAAQLGGRNREWIFTDQQLRSIMMEAAVAGQAVVVRELRSMREDINEFNGRIHIVERDVGEASNRYAARKRRRSTQRR